MQWNFSWSKSPGTGGSLLTRLEPSPTLPPLLWTESTENVSQSPCPSEDATQPFCSAEDAAQSPCFAEDFALCPDIPKCTPLFACATLNAAVLSSSAEDLVLLFCSAEGITRLFCQESIFFILTPAENQKKKIVCFNPAGFLTPSSSRPTDYAES
ncbi:hypothetical protein AMELA_G00147950 [Ameiurus melas]|uniref:Uncharacterized protein n=1 Tax=Ameiurus melas TaxID=219545 RepID=A0A7J6AGP4_AMEME|nr:hypothetical protein AMELA_G00147950 [Ameiurus melas]